MGTVQLEFVGHACFRLWQDDHPSIVMDPYTHEVLELPDDGFRLEADTVIVSSLTDTAHDNVDLVMGNPQVINALDVAIGDQTVKVNGESLITVPAAEAPDHTEHNPLDNAMYAFKAGDLWFCHMGDLGYRLTDEELAPFRDHCDVFLVITGERNTPSFEDLDPMIDFLAPKWLVPMHYNLPPVAPEMSGLDQFLDHRQGDPVIFVRDEKVTFPLPSVKAGRPTIVVLEPSGYTREE
jgi:L-ascorbate metabolism protein UlaG (beta-lactamase superfamily)